MKRVRDNLVRRFVDDEARVADDEEEDEDDDTLQGAFSISYFRIVLMNAYIR